jgi:hypothetical protein
MIRGPFGCNQSAIQILNLLGKSRNGTTNAIL